MYTLYCRLALMPPAALHLYSMYPSALFLRHQVLALGSALLGEDGDEGAAISPKNHCTWQASTAKMRL